MNNTETNRKKLSIIIPTRDRPDTLLHSVRTALAQESDDIEILVSDNFSSPAVKEVFDSFNDKRLRYVRTPERIGMSDHYEFAVANSSGEWVTIIGDDDGLVPGAADKFFKLHRKHPDIKAIVFYNSFFSWPTKEGDTSDAKLVIATGKGYEVRYALDCLKRTMHGEILSIPTIYTGGFMSRDIIEDIKKVSPEGKFFQSMIPDVYSGMAFCSVIDKFIFSRECVSIAGSSKHGNGRQHKDRTHEEMKKLDFYKENRLKFLPELGDGAVESMQILMYETFLRSKHLRKDDLGTSIAQQIELSLLMSGHKLTERVAKYCKNVAEINNLNFDEIYSSYRKKKPKFKLRKLLKKIARKIPGGNRITRKTYYDLGLNNIYDAAVKIKQMQDS